MKRKIIFLLITIIIITLALLSGCGQQEQPTTTGQQTEPSAAQESQDGQKDTPGGGTNTAQSTYAAENNGSPGSTGKQPDAPPVNPPQAVTPGENRNTARSSGSITTLSPLPEITADEKIDVQGKTKTGNRVFINGKEAAVSPVGRFKQEILLKPGENRLEITTLGKKSVEDKQELTVKYQPPAPKLLLIAPDSSDSETITLSGETEPDCIVYVNSNRTLPDKTGKFTLPVKLRPGSNTIRVVSANGRGGQASATKKISFTPPEPRLVVIVPDETTGKQLNISGITDENAVLVVFVNDVKTSVNNQNGVFSGTVQLQEGLNAITVQVANKWGKIKTEHKNVYCEITDNTSGL